MMCDAAIPLVCPKCAVRVDTTIAWLHQNHVLRCPACGGSSAINKDAITLAFIYAQLGPQAGLAAASAPPLATTGGRR